MTVSFFTESKLYSATPLTKERANQGFFSMLSVEVAYSICTLRRFSYRNFDYHLPPAFIHGIATTCSFFVIM